MSNANLLAELNNFRTAEGKAPFADFRPARHMPVLTAYRDAAKAVEPETVAEPIAAAAEPVAKVESYKVLARMSSPKSLTESPVAFVFTYLDANPTMPRKAAVAALVKAGVNYSTARTQYQRWFASRKG